MKETKLTRQNMIADEVVRILDRLRDTDRALLVLQYVAQHYRIEKQEENLERLKKPLHKYQQAILDVAKREDIHTMTLTELGREIGLINRQNVKYHKEKLKALGLV
jgi:hypothetical protein